MPPAEGEVERLAAWLEQQPGGLGRRAACARVAELLQRQAAELERLRLVPVPVSGRLPEAGAPGWVAVNERPPGPADLDERGRCWWPVQQSWPCVYLMQPAHALAGEASHWLPAAALPLPPAEEEG